MQIKTYGESSFFFYVFRSYIKNKQCFAKTILILTKTFIGYLKQDI